MKRLLTVIAVFLFLTTPSAGQDFNKGVRAYERGDYAAAMLEWRPFAENGNATAQYNVGQLYFLGRGVLQNYAEALKWHTLAADQGHAPAQSIIGRMYATGRGVPQDFLRAYMWYELAAAFSTDGRFSRDARFARDDAARNMTAEQIADAQDLAREWMAKKGR